MLAALFGEHDGVTLVGNHGASITTPEESARVAGLIRALSLIADEYPGAVVESKPTGASFHYRHAENPTGAADAARAVVVQSGTTVIEGKMIVEAVVGEGDKGTAITELRNKFHAKGVVFIGDDVTDEAAFKVLGPHDVGIRVGPGPTVATYRVPDVPAVAEVFTQLTGYLPHS